MKTATHNGRRPVTIAMVTYLFPPTFAGGARHALELAKALRARGIESFFIGANLEQAPAYEVYEGFPLHRITTTQRSRLAWLRFAITVCAILWSGRARYDVIHLHSIRPFYFIIAAFATLLRKPLVLSPTLMGHDDPMSLDGHSFLWRLERRTYRRYDAVICKSSAIRQSCLAAGLPETAVVQIPGAIPCGTPDSLFRPADSRDEVRRLRTALRLPHDAFLATFVGRVQPRKGCDLLFEAWELLLATPSFQGWLLLVGPHGADPSGGERQFAALLQSFLPSRQDKRVLMTGNVAYAEVARYLRASDCFVFPSQNEGLPKAVIEAMASGLPAICTRIPNVTEDIIDHDVDGIILDDRRARSLADAILALAENQSLRERLARNAVVKVHKRFSADSVAGQHLDLYDRLLNRRVGETG
jgi:glycosyltransferase involved in cell wall biosynthesis